MDDCLVLNPAQTVLVAVQLASEADITSLSRLITTYPKVLKIDLVLRIILTFLPESTDPARYIEFLRAAYTGSLENDICYTGRAHSIPSSREATSRARRLHLLPLADPTCIFQTAVDPLTLFLLHRAQRIDYETGCLLLVSQLIEPFLHHSEHLRTWAIATLLPLLRLEYEYYPHNGLEYSLVSFEITSGKAVISSLLSEAGRKIEYKFNTGRDLRGLVGPWMYGNTRRKRRKRKHAEPDLGPLDVSIVSNEKKNDTVNQEADDWNEVNNWLLILAVRDFPRAAAAVLQWNGPLDVDYGGWDEGRPQIGDARCNASEYAQACLALVYASIHWSPELLHCSYLVYQKAAKLIDMYSIPELNIERAGDLGDLSFEYLQKLSPASFLSSALLHTDNLLTTPSKVSLQLCYLLLLSSTLLESSGFQISPKILAELSLFGGEAEQLAELQKLSHILLSKPKDRNQWLQIRKQVLWLRNWGMPARSLEEQNPNQPYGVFCRVGMVNLEIEMLKVLLSSSHYDLAKEIYCKQPQGPIPIPVLEGTVLSTALSYFDSASNGNRTRGGVRKASEIISTFQNYFPDSEPVRQVLALLSATHAMSYYSLILQHGVPFQPVNIRAHKDPLSLIEKILAQNIHSYTKLDDLLEIGKNLELAGLNGTSEYHDVHSSPEKAAISLLENAKRRITVMAIEAAIAENDFDTAYSYVVNRLSPRKFSMSSTSQRVNEPRTVDDDISWRAALKAGCYTSAKSGGPFALRRLEQRMELLSYALLLAPASALSEVLVGWRECEEELASLSARETEEEEKWDDRGDQRLPGGYSFDSSPVLQIRREPILGAQSEEAPMGLFDVARGAASALTKNAFPLRSPQDAGADTPSRSSQERSMVMGGVVENESLTGANSEGRVRKRDKVSNMVTGGLASGIGWVIGAPPNRTK